MNNGDFFFLEDYDLPVNLGGRAKSGVSMTPALFYTKIAGHRKESIQGEIRGWRVSLMEL